MTNGAFILFVLMWMSDTWFWRTIFAALFLAALGGSSHAPPTTPV